MSVSTEKTIWCDGPGCVEWEQQQRTAAEIRRSLKRIGWTHERGRDFCPDCKSHGSETPARHTKGDGA